MKSKTRGNRCKARTKAGKPCRAAATEGGLCFFHTNPDKASELGRIGGRKNRHAPAGNVDLLPRLENARAVRNTVDHLFERVYSGKLPPRVASVLVTLLNLQLRAIETADLERRIAKMVKQRGAEEFEEGNAGVPELDLGSIPGATNKPRSESEAETNGEDRVV
jgi:hypothetical protein